MGVEGCSSREQAVAATVASRSPGKSLGGQVPLAIPTLWTVGCRVRINTCRAVTVCRSEDLYRLLS